MSPENTVWHKQFKQVKTKVKPRLVKELTDQVVHSKSAP